jgi:hypothetical protein
MRGLLNWIKGMLLDADGNPSSKRHIAIVAFALFIYAVIDDKDPEVLRVIVGLITLALGITIPDKFAKNNKN